MKIEIEITEEDAEKLSQLDSLSRKFDVFRRWVDQVEDSDEAIAMEDFLVEYHHPLDRLFMSIRGQIWRVQNEEKNRS